MDNDERGGALTRIKARQKPWQERMCGLRGNGSVAWQARARLLALWDRDVLADYEASYTEQRALPPARRKRLLGQ